MEFPGVDAQPVLIAHVDGDGFVLFQVADVLVDKSQRSVGRPLGDYVLLNLLVFGGHIEIQRWVLGVRRPGSGDRKRSGEAWNFGGILGTLGRREGCVRRGIAAASRASGRHAARAHDVEGTKIVGVLDADPAGARHRVRHVGFDLRRRRQRQAQPNRKRPQNVRLNSSTTLQVAPE